MRPREAYLLTLTNFGPRRIGLSRERRNHGARGRISPLIFKRGISPLENDFSPTLDLGEKNWGQNRRRQYPLKTEAGTTNLRERIDDYSPVKISIGKEKIGGKIDED